MFVGVIFVSEHGDDGAEHRDLGGELRPGGFELLDACVSISQLPAENFDVGSDRQAGVGLGLELGEEIAWCS
jgi:hypothetical protein